MSKIGCPFCSNGKVTETYITGDGQPNVPVEVHTETNACEFCGGEGSIPESKLDGKK